MLGAFVLAGCGDGGREEPDGTSRTGGPSEPDGEPGAGRTPSSETPTSSDPRHGATHTPEPEPEPTPGPSSPGTPLSELRFRASGAGRHVDHLAGRIGPREATSRAFRAAAAYVERGFRQAGLETRRQGFDVPSGESWGVPVPSGRTLNVIAYPPGLDRTTPHLVVGAHLDTIPRAPGAEDNASGVAVLLELARMVGAAAHRLPVVLVAFGAEEPRGDGDDRHHYGSKAYLRALRTDERRGIRQMVSLDRVGLGPAVRIRTAGVSARQAGPPDPIGRRVERRLAAAARRIGVPVETGDINRASDHWPFHLAGVPAARIGGNPYPAYHSERDRPGVVDREQLGRTGRLVWAWLTSDQAAAPAGPAAPVRLRPK